MIRDLDNKAAAFITRLLDSPLAAQLEREMTASSRAIRERAAAEHKRVKEINRERIAAASERAKELGHTRDELRAQYQAADKASRDAADRLMLMKQLSLEQERELRELSGAGDARLEALNIFTVEDFEKRFRARS